MKLHNSPAYLRMVDGRPVAVRYGGRWHRVRRMIDYWREAGRWWLGEAEEEFVRLETSTIITLHRRRDDGQWYVLQACD
ncbi:MAG: hypothetical protein H5T86_01590 [Armatimonadetes bacterium]|nr:hypothetical protein [Armatimonadota bacterium]